MSDEETPQINLAYKTGEDIPEMQKFAFSKKGGFVEEEVLKWIDNTLNSFKETVDDYNQVVYALLGANKTIEDLQAEIEVLRNTNGGAVAPVAAPVTDETEEPVTPVVVEGYTEEQLLEYGKQAQQAVESEYSVQVVELKTELAEKNDALAQLSELERVNGELSSTNSELMLQLAAVPEETDRNISETNVANKRAQEILDTVNKQVKEHVENTFANVEKIERNAKIEADEIVTAAEEEARQVRQSAVDEANEAIAIRNNSTAEHLHVLKKLESFFAGRGQEIVENIERLSPLAPLENARGLGRRGATESNDTDNVDLLEDLESGNNTDVEVYEEAAASELVTETVDFEENTLEVDGEEVKALTETVEVETERRPEDTPTEAIGIIVDSTDSEGGFYSTDDWEKPSQ